MARSRQKSEEQDPTDSDRRFVMPFPILEWSELLRAINPGRSVTRGLLRSLRGQGRLSPGVTVTRRGAQGLAGRATYNSALWAWSERCHLAGWDDDAQYLRKAATELEGRFGGSISSYLVTHELRELPEAEFFSGLMFSTTSALMHCGCVDKLVLASGTVRSMENGLGQVVGRTPAGAPATVDLPQWLLLTHHAVEGDPVWVLSRKVGDAALVEVERALMVGLDREFAAPLSWALEPELESREESDEEAARRYDHTAAWMPPSRYWDELVADARAGKLPERHLRPVG